MIRGPKHKELHCRSEVSSHGARWFPLRGCGWPLAKVEALIKDDPETLAMWRKAVTPAKHGHLKMGTLSPSGPIGVIPAPTCSPRLKDEFPAI
jgi:hypothetical protein